MTSRKAALAEDQRTNIRMSKLSRALQTATAKTNWSDMVKMLFRADPHGGRKNEIRKLISLNRRPSMPDQSSSYNFDQAQYLLLLMLIISIAEKRTQDLYVQNFAQRCDAIGKEHDLGDDEYWQNEAVPAEWSELNREFEEASRRILVETLSEYHQQEIAKLIETEGAEDFFEIIRNIRVQFSRVFTNSDPDNTHPPTDQSGSFPETLLSFRKMVSTTS